MKRKKFNAYSEAIGDLEVRNFYLDPKTNKKQSLNSTSGFQHFELVQWYPNPHYSKYEEYLAQGYELSFLGGFLRKDGHSIDINFFNGPASCCVIAYWQLGKEGSNLVFVGDRPFNLTSEQLDIFWRLVGNAQIHIDSHYK